MESRDSFVFYASWWNAIKNLKEDVRWDVLTAIMEYGLHGVLVENQGRITRAFIEMAKPNIDANKERYELAIKNGRKGGAPMGNRNNRYCEKYNQSTTKVQPGTTQYNLNVNDNVNVNENDNDNALKKENLEKKESPFFKKPTVEEVRAYVLVKGYTVDAENFVNFYESKGWMIGKNKMKNWRAAVATWQKAENERYNGAIQQKQEDRRAGLEVKATCSEDYKGAF